MAGPSKRTLYARGDTTAAVITKTRLEIVPEGTVKLSNLEPRELARISHHMPQGTLSCYAIHLEGHEDHKGFQR